MAGLERQLEELLVECARGSRDVSEMAALRLQVGELATQARDLRQTMRHLEEKATVGGAASTFGLGGGGATTPKWEPIKVDLGVRAVSPKIASLPRPECAVSGLDGRVYLRGAAAFEQGRATVCDLGRLLGDLPMGHRPSTDKLLTVMVDVSAAARSAPLYISALSGQMWLQGAEYRTAAIDVVSLDGLSFDR